VLCVCSYRAGGWGLRDTVSWTEVVLFLFICVSRCVASEMYDAQPHRAAVPLALRLPASSLRRPTPSLSLNMASSPPEHDYLAANTASSDEGMEVTNPDDPGALCSDRVCGDRLCVPLGCDRARMFTRMQAQTFQTQNCESDSLPPTLFLRFFLSMSPPLSGHAAAEGFIPTSTDRTRVMRIVGGGLP